MHYATLPTSKKGKAMNALKTCAKQIEAFGTWMRAENYKDATCDIYRLDAVTNARIWQDKRGYIKQVTFEYAMR